VSYFDRCPDRWEAESEGRHDAERDYCGYYRSPNLDHFDCDDAQHSYEDAYRREMRHQEDRREEREAEDRAERLRLEAAMEEDAYQQAMNDAELQAEYDATIPDGVAIPEEEKT
jgi:hypothetical protein